MQKSTCDVCGQCAVVHETVVEAGGVVKTRHYCELHAGQVREDLLRIYAPDRDATMSRLADWYGQLTEAEKQRMQMERLLTRRRV